MLVVLCLLGGVLLGVGAVTLLYSKGYAYLTNDPRACANCHVMEAPFQSWSKSSHHAVAVCNDCHTPPSFVGKWMTKAQNGVAHSVAFTSGRFHEPIRIKEHSTAIVERACRNCHQAVVGSMTAVPHGKKDDMKCVHCHASAGHVLK